MLGIYTLKIKGERKQGTMLYTKEKVRQDRDNHCQKKNRRRVKRKKKKLKRRDCKGKEEDNYFIFVLFIIFMCYYQLLHLVQYHRW
jgi:hypothetical protein